MTLDGESPHENGYMNEYLFNGLWGAGLTLLSCLWPVCETCHSLILPCTCHALKMSRTLIYRFTRQQLGISIQVNHFHLPINLPIWPSAQQTATLMGPRDHQCMDCQPPEGENGIGHRSPWRDSFTPWWPEWFMVLRNYGYIIQIYGQQIGWWTISVLLQTFGRVVRFYLNASTMGGCLKLKILKNQRNPPQDMDWKCTPTKFRECLLGYLGVYCWWTKSCISWCACIEWYTYACKPVIFSADTLDGQNPAPISDNSSSSCLNMLKPSQLVQEFAQTTLYYFVSGTSTTTRTIVI